MSEALTPRDHGYEEEREFRMRMTSAPWAFQLQELVVSALPVAEGLLADQLYSLSEQLEGCMSRRQDIDRESVSLVLDVVWAAELAREAR